MFGERWYHQNEDRGKGSAFAVLDVKNYLKESERQFKWSNKIELRNCLKCNREISKRKSAM